MQQIETEGIVLANYPYKERDKLVKIMTASAGKQMCLVKRGVKHNHPFYQDIQPLACATYSLSVNPQGLSFIKAVKQQHPFRNVTKDIEKKAYAIYMAQLLDAATVEHESDPLLYGYFRRLLTLMDDGLDEVVLAFLFETQLLKRFGVQPQWQQCTLCQESAMHAKFDYSPETGGIICYRHFDQSLRRYHAHPRAVYFLRLFQSIDIEQLTHITMIKETKYYIRQLLDQLYDDYVGIHVKSRRFIDQLATYEQMIVDKSKDNF